MNKHVFIAVGGSGTKVAEALVRLLAIGFPTRFDNNSGLLTSAGDQLQIWRVDPSRSAGAADDLKDAIKEYSEIQRCLASDTAQGGVAGSAWSMDIEIEVCDLDPLALDTTSIQANSDKTLNNLLNSQLEGAEVAKPLLTPFYSDKDLNVKVDKGFYQKPFIGSAVISVFSKSLESPNSAGGKIAKLTSFDDKPVNFFLCGSLHGGTGACGVPVLGKFLSSRRKEGWGWRVGGCMLDPYFKPIKPPFDALDPDNPQHAGWISDLSANYGYFDKLQPDTQHLIDDRVAAANAKKSEAFAVLNNHDEKRSLAWEILLGFYADPDTIIDRAQQGLNYYRDHGGKDFDELYLVGKPTPTQYDRWSNGGKSQKNPLNSAEFVAALAALNFFTQAETGNKDSYVIASAGTELPNNGEQIRLHHLPTYQIKNFPHEIDPEKVYVATAMMNHVVLHTLDWARSIEGWDESFKLREVYQKDDIRKKNDKEFFATALRLISKSLIGMINPNSTVGWSVEDHRQLLELLASDEATVSKINNRLSPKKTLFERLGFRGKEDTDSNIIGESAVKFTAFDFASWAPQPENFTRGAYLRHVWTEIYRRCDTRPTK